MKRIALLFSIMLLPVFAGAQTIRVVIGNVRYGIRNMTATVIAHQDENEKYAGNISIPASIDYNGRTYPVTAIADKTFYKCPDLISVSVAGNSISIGESAFAYCPNLTSVILPDSILKLSDFTFVGCTNLSYITPPRYLKEVGYSSFGNCSSLKSFPLPASVEAIGPFAFYKCENLSSPMIIPEGVEVVSEHVFEGCKSIPGVTIPSSVTNIKYAAFWGCDSLKDVYCYATTVPNTEHDAFYVWKETYLPQVTLHVPAVSIADYEATSPWNHLGAIVPLETHPVDMTSRIVNPRFDNNDVTTGWSGTRFDNWNTSWISKENAEIYNKDYNAFQKIEGLPAGIYAVGVKALYMAGEELQIAFYRYKANSEESHYAKLYAEANGRQTETDICSVFDNQVKEPLGCTGEMSFYDEETGRTYYFPKNPAAAERYMHELNCYDNKVLAMVDEGLTIGVKKNSTVYGDWSAFDDFTLTYYGQGADAYQMYLDDIWEKNMNKAIVAEGALYTKYYLDEYCKHRYATTKEEANVALTDIQSANSLLQRNIELWKEWKLEMNRGCSLAASPYYAGSEQAQLLAQHCSVEAAKTEATHSLTNEQLEAEISKTNAMIDELYTQEGFADKMLKEGKQWVYSHHRNSVVTKVTYTINGDTLIGGRHYAKLYKEEEGQPRTFYLALREEGTTVYSYMDNEDKRLIEFNPYHFRDVQSLSYYDRYFYTIDVVDNIRVNDREFVRHKYKDENGSDILPIGVEGIGYEFNGILGMSFEYMPSDYIRFEACYEDGKCIFTADDFNVRPDTKPADNMAYRPFVEEGKVWKVGSTLIRDDLVKMVEYYYFDGDTIIDGKTCKQMMRQRYVNPEYPDYSAVMQFPLLSYVGAWYEEDKKVYLYNASSKQFMLKYDFSVDANDTIQIRDYYLYVIGPRQTGGIKGFKGVYRDVMTPWEVEQSTIYNTTWLEGVGGIDGPTVNVYYGKEGHAIFLMECAVGDEVIYLNDEYEDGATPEGARKRFDFTHTVKTKPQARTRSEEGQSLYGEYNDKQLGINLDPLDDAYQVRITDETGKVVYEKAVNAGNVVGLNIDISSYAKGRYTVTVENSQETFTGEFDAQATGFAEVRSITKEASGPIYNLQGQRLSTLQKGLNIVNGQKVYVK